MQDFILPFQFGSLNAGIFTLYELFNRDRDCELSDLNLFFLFLEVYGTGWVVLDDGSLVHNHEKWTNSTKRVTQIASELQWLMLTPAYKEVIEADDSFLDQYNKGLWK